MPRRLTWAEYNQRRGLGELPPHTQVPVPLNPPQGTDTVAAKNQASVVNAWQNPFSATQRPFVIGTAAAQVLQANPRRCYLLIQNNSSAVMYVAFGGVSVNSVQIQGSGGYWEFGGGGLYTFCPPNAVYILGSAADQAGVAVEGVLSAIG